MVSILKDELENLKNEVLKNEKRHAQLKTENQTDSHALEKLRQTYNQLEEKFEQSKAMRSNQDKEIFELRKQLERVEQNNFDDELDSFKVFNTRKLKYLSPNPQAAIQLLINKFSRLRGKVLREEDEKRELIQEEDYFYVTVFYEGEFCKVRIPEQSYTMEDLCRDMSVYFHQDPKITCLKDETYSVWSGKSPVKEELQRYKDAKVILSFKAGMEEKRNLKLKYDHENSKKGDGKVDDETSDLEKKKSKKHNERRILGGDMDNDDDEGFFSYTIGLIGYLIFIIVLLLNINEKFSLQKGLYMTNMIEEEFIYKKFPVNDNTYITQLKIMKWDEIFYWLTLSCSDALFPTITKIDANTRIQNAYAFFLLQIKQQRLLQSTTAEVPTLLQSNQFLGKIRFKQNRIAHDACTINEKFTKSVNISLSLHCNPDYDNGLSSKEDYGLLLNDFKEICAYNTKGQYVNLSKLASGSVILNNGTTVTYRVANETCFFLSAFHYSTTIPNSLSKQGRLAQYSAKGFYIDFYPAKSDFTKLVNFLQDNLWIDPQSRSFMLMINLYNKNYNYFTYIELGFEFDSSGNIQVMNEYYTYQLSYFISLKNLFNSWNSFLNFVNDAYLYIYVVLMIMNKIKQYLDVRVYPKQLERFYKNTWNILDFIFFTLNIIVIFLKFYISFVANDFIDKKFENLYEDFLDIKSIALNIQLLKYLECILAFMGLIRLHNIIRVKSISLIWDTLFTAAPSLFTFSLIFIIVELAFISFAYALYGSSLEGYKDFQVSALTVIRIIIGDLSVYGEMNTLEPVLTPIFLIFYCFFVFFLLLKIFSTILNEAFSAVRISYEEAAKLEGDKLTLMDYWNNFKKGMDKRKVILERKFRKICKCCIRKNTK